jgi:MYXO-CTERM domain-containing protein
MTRLGVLVLVLLSRLAPAFTPKDAFGASREVRPLSAPARAAWEAGRISGQEPRLGVPTFVWATGASPRGLTPEQAARHHLLANAELYGASPAQWASVRLTRLHDLHDATAIIATFQQRIGEVRVFRDELTVIMNRDLELVALAGYLTPATRPLGAFVLRPESAIASAFQHVVGQSLDPLTVTSLGPAEGGYARWSLDGARPARTRPVWFPLPAGVVPAFYVELKFPSGWFALVISAVDGAVLFAHDLTVSHGYGVWADPVTHFPFPGPQGSDAAPHPDGSPNAFVPMLVPTQRVTLTHAGISTNDPWLAAGATQTRGNNVEAYADLQFPDGFSPGDLDAVTTAPDTFGPAWDPNLQPDANPSQRRAGIVQLFYTVNFLHDWYYDDGFDEAAGNAQRSNFMRGGLASDPLLAEAQDSESPDNADMSTPADGESPRMQVGVFSGGTVNHDGAIDTGLVAHEWGHFISNRLIGNGSGLETVQGAGMGEGWGDFHAALLLSEASDALVPSNVGWTGAWSVTGWASWPIDTQSYYWGFRRYPLSVSFARNPLTFRHIADGTPLPTTAPHGALGFGYPNSETHNTGEVWAVMLWECYVELLTDPRFTFDQARKRMKRYLVAAYKSTPSSPTFVEGRDALLAVALASDATDFAHFWNAFARRGLGRGAVAPDRFGFSNSPLVESFRVANPVRFGVISLDDTTLSCDGDYTLDGDEVGVLHVRLVNSDTAPVGGGTLTVSSTTSQITFPGGVSWPVPALGALGTGTVNVPVALGDVVGVIAGSFSLSVGGGALGTDQVTTTALIDLNFDVNARGMQVPDTCVNLAPTCTVGPDTEAEESVRVELVGSCIDPEGAPVTLTWAQTVGPAGVVRGSGFTTPDVTNDAQVTLLLTGTDGRATSSPLLQHLLVKNVNHAPIANAPLSVEGVPGQRITLPGFGSDSDGDPVTYRWTQVSGSPAVLDGVTTKTLRLVPPDVAGVEELKVQLVVSDAQTSSVPAVTVITVHGTRTVVEPAPEPVKKPGCGCSTGEAGLLALAAAWLLRRRRA